MWSEDERKDSLNEVKITCIYDSGVYAAQRQLLARVVGLVA
jgi:hypothetical protein